jgi:hypothetical protein
MYGLYLGNWKNDKRHGVGKQEYYSMNEDNVYAPDGSSYDGNWENDHYQGEGILTLTDGITYSGTFDSGLIVAGIFLHLKANTTYEGTFRPNGTFKKGKLITSLLTYE